MNGYLFTVHMLQLRARSHCDDSGIILIILVLLNEMLTSQMCIVAPNGGVHVAAAFLRPKLVVATTV